jgi:dTMP kinase
LETGMLRGKFVVLDGPDGAGKTSIQKRLAAMLSAASLAVTECKDPGGTRIGDRVRAAILNHDMTGMDVRCETLLFMASRAQLVSEVIRPALQAGNLVLCDRFVSSTCAYQAAAGDGVEAILRLADYAVGATWPDLTIVLDVPPEVGFKRIRQRGGPAHAAPPGGSNAAASTTLDSMERRPLSFHEAVRANFLDLPHRYRGPVQIVDATRPVDQVVDELIDRLGQFFTRKAKACQREGAS